MKGELNKAELPFEVLVLNKVKYGSYQKLVCMLLGLIFIADGMEMAALTILLPVLKKEFHITEAEIEELLGSVLFLGMFCGSLLAGFITDKIGRKTTLEYSSIATFFLGVLSVGLQNVFAFIFVRGCFGFLLGFVVPTVPTLASEILPSDKRGKIIAIINAAFSVGQIFANSLAYFCLTSLTEGHWRLLLFFCSLPPLLVFIGSKRYVYESPRYEMISGEVEKCVEILNKIGLMNDPNYKPLTESETKDLLTSVERLRFDKTKQGRPLLDLFRTKKVCRITICLWTMWFFLNFVYYGLILILPYFLSKSHDKSGILRLIITTLGETSSIIPVLYLIEHESFGRKNTIFWGFVVSSLCCFLSFYLSNLTDIFVIVLLLAGRFFIKMCFNVIYPFTPELYSTYLRTTGVAMASAMGRIGSCLMPMIAIKLFYINRNYPFLAYSIFGAIAAVATYLLPYDTQGKFLDHDHEIEVPLIEMKAKEETKTGKNNQGYY